MSKNLLHDIERHILGRRERAEGVPKSAYGDMPANNFISSTDKSGKPVMNRFIAKSTILLMPSTWPARAVPSAYFFWAGDSPRHEKRR